MITDVRPSAARLPARGAGRSAWTGSAVCTMPAVPAAVPALRHFARSAAGRWALPPDCEAALELIVTELAANAVKHSGSPDVSLLLTRAAQATTVQIEVKDSGRWRSRPTAEAALPLDRLACGGRGLLLVEAHASSYVLWRTERGTRVVVELSLPGN